MAPPPLDAAQATVRVESCELTIGAWNWPFPEKYAADIGREWRMHQAANPSMFDGAIYLVRNFSIEGGRLAASMFRTDFKSFLFWRSHPELPDDGICEAFGASIIRSAEGHVLLGRQSAGNLNSGKIYPPCGLIDDDDVRGDRIDIDASVTRELGEETGLAPSQMQRAPGYLLTLTPRQIAIGVEWRSTHSAEALREDVMATLRSLPDPELDDVVIVRTQGEFDAARTPAFVQILLRSLLPA
jgi:8-oxo-dGTP pyrophosphatase MutT (NUDIX family)